MSAMIAQRVEVAGPAANISTQAKQDATKHDALPFDAINLESKSIDDAYQVLSKAASTTGVALIPEFPVRPPVAAIQNLFERLYANPTLATRLNATYSKRGVFKSACLAPNASPSIDQKTTIDLSVKRLQALCELDPALVQMLGKDFSDVLQFYTYIENHVLPIITEATSSISGAHLGPTHNGTNNHLRLIDYFSCVQPSGPCCGEHRDYNTYTIIFQDGAVGGLEFDVDGKWIQVPASVEAVVSWGWCGAILSNDKIKAAKHRVLNTWPAKQRRTTVVVFVAPDLESPLKPMGGLHTGEGEWCREIREGQMSVGGFKEFISKKWRRREGNEPGEVIDGSQDREVEAFLKPRHGSTCD